MVDRRIAIIAGNPGAPGLADAGGPDGPAGSPDASLLDGDPPAEQRFVKLGVGQSLPTDAVCAARVRRSTWEPRPDNDPYNRSVPTAAQLGQLTPWDSRVGFDSRAVALGKRVNGDFVGTTDEILQWGACKWGFDEDFVRAYAQQASEWRQGKISSWTDNIANCPDGAATRMAFGGTECAQVYGILQLMWRYTKSTWPMSRDSTALNVDYALGQRRACYEGMLPWLKDSAPAGHPYVAGDEFGCLGADNSGAWYDPDGVKYMADVKAKLDAKSWLRTDF